MKISFVIPSVDRKIELQNCISSIESAYDYIEGLDLSIEIIVVFNGGYKSTSFLNVRNSSLLYFYCIEERSVSKARNLGIIKSTGEYLIFIDDDAMISKEYLNVLYNHILNNKETRVFYGRLLNTLNNEPYSKIYAVSVSSKYLRHFDYSYSGGTTLALERNVLDKIGLYDEQFGPGERYPGAEESDLFFRMLQAGEEILYLPELVIFHPVLRDTPSDKMYNYSYAVGAMLMKQMFCDPKKALIYFMIIFMAIFKNGIRALQNIMLPETIKEKNKRCKYASVFKGTLVGVINYIKSQCRWLNCYLKMWIL